MQQVKCSHLHETDLKKGSSSDICSVMDSAMLRCRIHPGHKIISSCPLLLRVLGERSPFSVSSPPEEEIAVIFRVSLNTKASVPVCLAAPLHLLLGDNDLKNGIN